LLGCSQAIPTPTQPRLKLSSITRILAVFLPPASTQMACPVERFQVAKHIFCAVALFLRGSFCVGLCQPLSLPPEERTIVRFVMLVIGRSKVNFFFPFSPSHKATTSKGTRFHPGVPRANDACLGRVLSLFQKPAQNLTEAPGLGRHDGSPLNNQACPTCGSRRDRCSAGPPTSHNQVSWSLLCSGEEKRTPPPSVQLVQKYRD
jgi:hypothetical protein